MQWSNSALTTLQQCGEKFRRRYLELERVPPSARMLSGTVVHRVARTAYERKLGSGTLPSIPETRDTAATAFEAQWSGGVLLAADEQAEGLPTIKARAKDFSVAVSAYHVDKVAPGITPRAVERRIIVRPQNASIEIHGTVDLIAAVRDGGEVIRDLKTSARMPPADAADTSQQLTMYALIRMAETRTLPQELALDYLVRSPVRGDISYKPLTTTRTPGHIDALVERINAGVRAVERGTFMPAPPDAWWCSAQWCEYHSTCKYVARGATRPAA